MDNQLAVGNETIRWIEDARIKRQLEELAESQGLSMAGLLRTIVREYFAKIAEERRRLRESLTASALDADVVLNLAGIYETDPGDASRAAWLGPRDQARQ